VDTSDFEPFWNVGLIIRSPCAAGSVSVHCHAVDKMLVSSHGGDRMLRFEHHHALGAATAGREAH
jgi:hypothetical protein